jgi:23S rRNA (pseudouridine1915-N3)-methyltransferase
MKLKLICIGKIKEPSLKELIADYSERITRDAKLEILEIKDSNIKDEGKKIKELIEKIKENRFIFVLTEEGRQLSSVEFSNKLKQHDLEGKTLCFVIGGPFGLSEEAKKQADMHLSLSKMTFTHEMARLFLLEQLYRAISIIKNKSYHK